MAEQQGPAGGGRPHAELRRPRLPRQHGARVVEGEVRGPPAAHLPHPEPHPGSAGVLLRGVPSERPRARGQPPAPGAQRRGFLRDPGPRPAAGLQAAEGAHRAGPAAGGAPPGAAQPGAPPRGGAGAAPPGHPRGPGLGRRGLPHRGRLALARGLQRGREVRHGHPADQEPEQGRGGCGQGGDHAAGGVPRARQRGPRRAAGRVGLPARRQPGGAAARGQPRRRRSERAHQARRQRGEAPRPWERAGRPDPGGPAAHPGAAGGGFSRV
mmetsp:Transcript_29795/g.83243  ORF Transcript_29795/g.83243 Transcript_29795/m.83243 type:complete len:268 (+) Transcript_29795:3060-3863(+)